MKWGEYSSDVQFILQRSDQTKPASNLTTQQQQQIPKHQPKETIISTSPSSSTQSSCPQMLDRNREIRTSFNLLQSEGKMLENVGIVKGIPQVLNTVQPPLSPSPSSLPEITISTANISSHIRASSDTSNITPSSCLSTQQLSTFEFNSADVRNSLDRKTNLFREARHLSNEHILEAYNARDGSNSNNDIYKNGPPISSNGALVPPPYRDPPPPRTSPLHQKSDSLINIKKIDDKVSTFFIHIPTLIQF